MKLSDERIWIAWAMPATFTMKLRCVRTAPFCRPVVPEV